MQPVTEPPEPAARPDPTPDASARAPTATAVAPRTVPRTAQQLAALRRQRDELVQQLTGTHGRRRELLEEMRQTDVGGQAVLRQQMAELDRRVLQLETDLSNIDHVIAVAPATLGVEAGVLRAAEAVGPPGFVLLGPSGPSANAVPVLLLVVTLLQVVLLVRSRVRRAPISLADAAAREAARLARLEQAVDAIAVEVERVSEGQRFVTRLLSEQQAQLTRRVPAPAREYPTPT